MKTKKKQKPTVEPEPEPYRPADVCCPGVHTMIANEQHAKNLEYADRPRRLAEAAQRARENAVAEEKARARARYNTPPVV